MNNYAIIDKMSGITPTNKVFEVEVPKPRIYAKENKAKNFHRLLNYKVEEMAKADGFETIYTMTQVCQALHDNPNCKQTYFSTKYKAYARNQTKPRKVYLICENVHEETTKRALKQWESLKAEIEIIEINPIEQLREENQDNENEIRSIVAKWQKPIGYNSTYPIQKPRSENNITLYSARPDFKERIKIDEKHTTKTHSTCKSYTLETKAIEPIESVKAMYFDLMARAKLSKGTIQKDGTFKGNNAIMNTLIDCDFVICEECGNPRNKRTKRNQMQVDYSKTESTFCPYCETEYKDGIAQTERSYEEYMQAIETIEEIKAK